MTSFSFDSVINSSIDGITVLLNNITTTISSFVASFITEENIKTYTEGLFILYNNLTTYLYFDDLQLKLFKGFIVFLFINLFLIYISWKVYGKRICERFMKPGIDICDSTSKAIEELKASVSKLKLPKEHSPRI